MLNRYSVPVLAFAFPGPLDGFFMRMPGIRDALPCKIASLAEYVPRLPVARDRRAAGGGNQPWRPGEGYASRHRITKISLHV